VLGWSPLRGEIYLRPRPQNNILVPPSDSFQNFRGACSVPLTWDSHPWPQKIALSRCFKVISGFCFLPKVRFLNKRCPSLKNVRSEPFILRAKVRFILLNGIPVPLQSSDPIFILLAASNTDERKNVWHMIRKQAYSSTV